MVGSIVKTGGKPQTTGLLRIADIKNEVDVLIIFDARRGVSERNKPLSRSSFKRTIYISFYNLSGLPTNVERYGISMLYAISAWILDTGCWMLDPRYWVLDTRSWILII